MLEVNPDAYKIAAKLDEERKNGKLRGPLHGIPFLLKDNIASEDKMETTAGSYALLGSIVPRDAHIVASLRNKVCDAVDYRSLTDYVAGCRASGQDELRFLGLYSQSQYLHSL